jgi:hypothetical protein
MQYQGSKMGNETFYTCENSTVPLPLNPRNDVVGWTPLTFIECLPPGWWDSITFKCLGK